MQASLHAHTREWSGNPAVLGCYALRQVALRPRLSTGLPLSVPGSALGCVRFRVLFKTRRTDAISRSRCHKHGRLRTKCLVVWD